MRLPWPRWLGICGECSTGAASIDPIEALRIDWSLAQTYSPNPKHDQVSIALRSRSKDRVDETARDASKL
jgi:hypothetical protein